MAAVSAPRLSSTSSRLRRPHAAADGSAGPRARPIRLMRKRFTRRGGKCQTRGGSGSGARAPDTVWAGRARWGAPDPEGGADARGTVPPSRGRLAVDDPRAGRAAPHPDGAPRGDAAPPARGAHPGGRPSRERPGRPDAVLAPGLVPGLRPAAARGPPARLGPHRPRHALGRGVQPSHGPAPRGGPAAGLPAQGRRGARRPAPGAGRPALAAGAHGGGGLQRAVPERAARAYDRRGRDRPRAARLRHVPLRRGAPRRARPPGRPALPRARPRAARGLLPRLTASRALPATRKTTSPSAARARPATARCGAFSKAFGSSPRSPTSRRRGGADSSPNARCPGPDRGHRMAGPRRPPLLTAQAVHVAPAFAIALSLLALRLAPSRAGRSAGEPVLHRVEDAVRRAAVRRDQDRALPAGVRGGDRAARRRSRRSRNPAPPTFANTVEALEHSGRLLDEGERASSTNLASARDERRAAGDREAVAPLLAAHRDDIRLERDALRRA